MRALPWLWLAATALWACGPTAHSKDDPSDAGTDAPQCARRCTEDLRSVLDCEDKVVETCSEDDTCATTSGMCVNACTAADKNRSSVGCDYYAVHMDTYEPKYCFAVFVANTWTKPAKISLEYDGKTFERHEIESFTRLPVGSGPGLTYAPYNAATGVPPGEVAVMFLGGESGAAPRCPTTTAWPNATKIGTSMAKAFHITTDNPVVAYQISPYGASKAAVTAASLLLPTSVWDTNYVAVNVGPETLPAGKPSLNIIAKENDTIATIRPVAQVMGGNGIPAMSQGQSFNLSLRKGEHIQISQTDELTGSVITSNKPIGFMAGHTCLNLPATSAFCDHGEQMIPPTRALGYRYAGVMYRPRVPTETSTYWRVVGAVDDTQLTWSTNVGGPTRLGKGQSVWFETGKPFVVSSQDLQHPFMLFGYMTSSMHVEEGYGDPDFVLMVPPQQYLKQYVFLTDPTYPETNLVLVRTRGKDQQYHDVTLDCLGVVTGWTAIDTEHEYARVDLSTGNFQSVGNCSTGRREIKSDAPFGLTVWGWGTPLTTVDTKNVSYGYPGGMSGISINNVLIN
jgi:hypothetical protein